MDPKGTQLTAGQETDQEPGVGLIEIDEAAIQVVKNNIALMEKVVTEVLIEGIHYGTQPGIPVPFLWDPGAGIIRDVFNVYPDPEVLSQQTDSQGLMTLMLKTYLISRKTGQVIATGIAAATMLESKYKYRWEEYPENWGYKKEDLKKKTVNKITKYRILNPDVSELVNTITKMCAKRAEVDGSQNLPGVASALAKLKKKKLDGRRPPVDTGTGEILAGPRDAVDWTHFWSSMKQMGVDSDKVHELCGVASMSDWLAKGRPLTEAVALVREWHIKQGDQDPPVEGEFTEGDRVIVDAEANEPIYEEMDELKTFLPTRDYRAITTLAEFNLACHNDFRVKPAEAIKCTGTTADQITDWGDAYLQVAAVYGKVERKD